MEIHQLLLRKNEIPPPPSLDFWWLKGEGVLKRILMKSNKTLWGELIKILDTIKRLNWTTQKKKKTNISIQRYQHTSTKS